MRRRSASHHDGLQQTGRLANGLVLVSALLIALGTVGGIISLRRYADDQRVAETRMAVIEARAFQLSALEWQAIAEERVNRALTRQLQEGQEVIAEEMRALRARSSLAFIERLSELNQPAHESSLSETLASVAVAADDFTGAINQMIQLIAQNQLDEARRVDALRVDPAFDRLAAALRVARAVHRDTAIQAGYLADVGSALMLLGAAGLMTSLFWRHEQSQRNAALNAREQAVVRASEERFRALAQNAAELIAIIDPHGTIQYLSPSVDRLLGPVATSALGQPIATFVYPDDTPRLSHLLDDALLEPGRTARAELRIMGANGDWMTFDALCTNLLTTPQVGGLVLNARDVTERKALEAELVHQAFHDPLTGLANRALFVERLQHALARTSRRGEPLAVLFLDLDNFKTVNDSLGHAAGDELLRVISDRLRNAVRAGDTVARFGGDEFALLLENLSDNDTIEQLADRLVTIIGAPLQIDEAELQIGSSIGLAVSLGRRENANELVRNADIAMYLAKREGKGRMARYAPELHAAIVERLSLEADLRRAFADQEFTLRYQPVVDLQHRQVVSIEALVRWEHPTRGVVEPHEFVPVAEEMGLILPLGRWVLREACRCASGWPTGPTGVPATISVNLSARQLETSDVIADVASVLAETGLGSSQLVLEITESLLVQQSEAIIARLQALRALGVRIAIDDFGTGYSSLSYLQHLPIDILKIDRTFIEMIDSDVEKGGVTQGIIQIGRSLSLQIIAEGVEVEGQAKALLALGCNLGQGYFFTRPLMADQLVPLLQGQWPVEDVGQTQALGVRQAS